MYLPQTCGKREASDEEINNFICLGLTKAYVFFCINEKKIKETVKELDRCSYYRDTKAPLNKSPSQRLEALKAYFRSAEFKKYNELNPYIIADHFKPEKHFDRKRKEGEEESILEKAYKSHILTECFHCADLLTKPEPCGLLRELEEDDIPVSQTSAKTEINPNLLPEREDNTAGKFNIKRSISEKQLTDKKHEYLLENRTIKKANFGPDLSRTTLDQDFLKLIDVKRCQQKD